MSSRRRRNTLDTAKFNARSLAIITVAAFCMNASRAQTGPSGTKNPTTAAAAGNTAETIRYLEAFERSDKNADGQLSKEESENLPAIAQRFELIDTNRDGNISKAEYLEALKQ